MKKIFFKVVSSLASLALVLAPFAVQDAYAASVTAFSMTLSRNKASTLSDYTIQFTTPTGVASGQIIILDFDNSTSIPVALDYEDIDLKDDGSDLTLAAAPSGATWGVVRTDGNTITFTNGTTAVAGGSVLEIQIGTNATFGSTGAEQITNGPTGTTTLTLSGSFGDTGISAVGIADDDQVTVTATVNSALTFDLDVGTTGAENTNAPYSVPLGVLSVSDVKVSGATDSVNRIMADFDTNAGSGVIMTVRNANGSNGLVSTSVPANNINSADGTMAAGTENYGLCVISVSAGTGTLSKAAPYNTGTCAADSNTNDVQALTTTGENMVSSAGPLATGRAQIAVNAAISGITAAATDYTDTLTFIATATF